jgi:hypothetical protein
MFSLFIKHNLIFIISFFVFIFLNIFENLLHFTNGRKELKVLKKIRDSKVFEGQQEDQLDHMGQLVQLDLLDQREDQLVHTVHTVQLDQLDQLV